MKIDLNESVLTQWLKTNKKCTKIKWKNGTKDDKPTVAKEGAWYKQLE